MMRTATIALLFLLLALPAMGAIYKWTDQNGVVHFSDSSHPGAVQLDVGQPPVYHPVPVPPQPEQGKNSAASAYSHFAISQPTPGATIRNNPGNVTVRLKIEPKLREGDRIRLLMDGKLVQSTPITGSQTVLHEVVRGTHTLSAVIENAAGDTVARADPVTFYMHRPSIHIPVNKNNKKSG